MDAVEASTLIYLPPEEVYAFLVDFPQYAKYSEYIQEVRRVGDGEPVEYDLEFTWWKLSYTARSAVTDVDPPERIDWKLITDLDAQGYWAIEHVPDEAPDEKPDASRVWFHVEFNPESADEDMINIPPFVPLDRIVQKVIPKIETEAHHIVRRIVADLEGEKRPVDLTIHQSPDSV